VPAAAPAVPAVAAGTVGAAVGVVPPEHAARVTDSSAVSVRRPSALMK
jgi:hypothetical protein